MEVIKFTSLHLLFNMSKPLGLIVIELWRIFNSKTCPLHFKEKLSAKFPVEAHLLYIKALFPHVNKPFDNRLMLCNRRIRHSKPPIILPAKKRNVILFRFRMGRHNREKGMCDYNINVFVSAI